VALARLGKSVGVIDADIYGPSQPTLLDAHARPEARDKQLIPVTSPSGVRLLSVGQLVPAGQALAWRGPMAAGALAQLIDGDWGEIDLILVDLPPGTGDVQLSLVQKARPAGAVIVSTPQDLALIDATRAIDLFTRTDVPVIGIIENMAGYVCPNCGEESDPFGSGGAEASAGKLGIPFLGRLPLSASLRQASDAGRPPAADEGPAGDAFAVLARAVLDALEKKPG
jgi:ATP-binding protein involved in chromosome partitioning